MVLGYEEGLGAPRTTAKAVGDGMTPIQEVMQQAKHRRWHHLAEERIEDVSPHIPLGPRFWELEPVEKDRIEKLFADETVVAKINGFKGNKAGSKIKVVDAAYWMKDVVRWVAFVMQSYWTRSERRPEILPH